MDNKINGQLDKWTNGQLNKWTNGQMDKWTDGQMDNLTYKQADAQMKQTLQHELLKDLSSGCVCGHPDEVEDDEDGADDLVDHLLEQDQGQMLYKLFLPVTYGFSNKASVFVKLDWKSLPRTNTLGECIIILITPVIFGFRNKVKCLALASRSSLIKCLGTNTLAYYRNHEL
jgi:hypothetical protein